MSEKTWVYEYPDADGAAVATLMLADQYERHVTNAEASVAAMRTYDNAMVESSSIMFSFRSGINQMSSSMVAILGITSQARDTTEKLRNAVMLSYITTQAYSYAISLLRARQTEESVWAAIETSVAMAAQQWATIALAVGAMALVVGSFEVGYQFGSGSWSFNADISTPQGRRQARDELANVRGG